MYQKVSIASWWSPVGWFELPAGVQMLNQSGLAIVPFGFSTIRFWLRGTSCAIAAVHASTAAANAASICLDGMSLSSLDDVTLIPAPWRQDRSYVRTHHKSI
jgi:hypothetical protein